MPTTDFIEWRFMECFVDETADEVVRDRILRIQRSLEAECAARAGPDDLATLATMAGAREFGDERLNRALILSASRSIGRNTGQ